MNIENFYNRCFGGYDEEKQEINDKVIANNGDILKALATVTSTVYAFTGKYPNAHVFVTGSTEVRTRLYRMGITTNLVEIQEGFYVYGIRQDELFEEFVAGEDYIGFLVTRKQFYDES